MSADAEESVESAGSGSAKVSAMRAANRAYDVRRRTGSNTEAAKTVVKDEARRQGVAAATKAAAAKGIPVAGLDRVAAKPTSVKAWMVAGSRTAVKATLTYFSGGTLGWVEEVIARVGYKRLLIGVVALMAVSVVTMVLVFMGIAAAVSTVLQPASIVSSVMDYVPGMGSDESGSDHLGRMCRTPMSPKPVPVETPSEQRVENDEEQPSEEPAPTFTPEPALDENGKLTPQTREKMQNIPHGADALQAESYLLYAMSHPADDANQDWHTFQGMFQAAKSYVLKEKDMSLPDAVKQLPKNEQRKIIEKRRDDPDWEAQVTPMEIVMNIDPNGTYEPFSLASSTATVTLIAEKYLTASDKQTDYAMGRMMEAC